MARTLKTSVQRENARQAVAALRNYGGDTNPPETRVEYEDLVRRIERIRVRGDELRALRPSSARDAKRSKRSAARALTLEAQPVSAIPTPAFR